MVTYPNTQPYAHSEPSTMVIRGIHRRYPCNYRAKSKENVAKAEHLQQFHPRRHHTSKVGYQKTQRDLVRFKNNSYLNRSASLFSSPPWPAGGILLFL